MKRAHSVCPPMGDVGVTASGHRSGGGGWRWPGRGDVYEKATCPPCSPHPAPAAAQISHTRPPPRKAARFSPRSATSSTTAAVAAVRAENSPRQPPEGEPPPERNAPPRP